MCHINALIQKEPNKNVTPFLMAITSNSFATNSDGEGFYCDKENLTYKSDSKIDYNNFSSQLSESKIIITHQRLSTSGKSKKYHHPFMSDDFVLVHNGVLSRYAYGNHSDTFGLFKNINKMFRKDKSQNREQKLFNIIKKLFKTDEGSYSILILDRITNKIYYFKDKSTRISVYKNDDFMFITTSYNNNRLISLLSTKSKLLEYEIKDRVFYRIENNALYNIGDLPTLPTEPKLISQSETTLTALSKDEEKILNNYTTPLINENMFSEKDYYSRFWSD